MSCRILMAVRTGGLLILLSAVPVHAGNVSLPFFEPFNTDTADAIATYPEFTRSGEAVTPTVVGGVLQMPFGSLGHQPNYSFNVTPNPTPTAEIVIKIDMGNTSGGGQGSAQLLLGNNKIVFHPNFDAGGSIQGAFRVEGPGGFPNTAVSFNPANAVLHHMEVHSFPSGLFQITLTDGNNPSNVFNSSFTSPTSYGGPIGPSYFSGGTGIFDNLSITVVPEPKSIMLLAGIGTAWTKLRRSRATGK